MKHILYIFLLLPVFLTGQTNQPYFAARAIYVDPATDLGAGLYRLTAEISDETGVYNGVDISGDSTFYLVTQSGVLGEDINIYPIVNIQLAFASQVTIDVRDVDSAGAPTFGSQAICEQSEQGLFAYVSGAGDPLNQAISDYNISRINAEFPAAGLDQDSIINTTHTNDSLKLFFASGDSIAVGNNSDPILIVHDKEAILPPCATVAQVRLNITIIDFDGTINTPSLQGVGTEGTVSEVGSGAGWKTFGCTVTYDLCNDLFVCPIDYTSTNTSITSTLSTWIYSDDTGTFTDGSTVSIRHTGCDTDTDTRDSVYLITHVKDTITLSPDVGDIFINITQDSLGVYGDNWQLFFGGAGGGITQIGFNGDAGSSFLRGDDEFISISGGWGVVTFSNGSDDIEIRLDTSLLATVWSLADSLANIRSSTVGGSVSENYIPVADSDGNLENSKIQDNGQTVSIIGEVGSYQAPFIIENAGSGDAQYKNVAIFRGKQSSPSILLNANIVMQQMTATPGNYFPHIFYNAVGNASSFFGAKYDDHDIGGTQSGSLLFGTFDEGSSGVRMLIDPSGDVGVGTTTPDYILDMENSTNAVRFPHGTTVQRPVGSEGVLRFNSTENLFEGYNGSDWTFFPEISGNKSTLTANNYVFNIDESPSGKDGHILTLNETSGEIELQAPTGMITGGFTGNTNSSSEVTIGHGLGTTPTAITVQGASDGDYTYAVTSLDGTNFTVKVRDGGSLHASSAISFYWVAYGSTEE
jgi:hypothetical protein